MLQLLSLYMTFNDFKWMLSFDRLVESNSELYGILFSDGKSSMYDYNMQYEVPVIMIAGGNDWTTPYCTALDYFNNISAPDKEFITIEHTGHIPFVDKSKEFSQSLIQALTDLSKNQ